MSLAEFGNNIAALFDGSRNANGSSKTPAEKLAEFLTLMGTMATDLVTAKGNLKGISNFSDVESASKAVISVAGALGAMSLTEGFNSLMTWSTNPLAGIIGGGPGNALKSFLGLISEVAEQLSTAYTSLKTAGIN